MWPAVRRMAYFVQTTAIVVVSELSNWPGHWSRFQPGRVVIRVT